MHVEVPDQATEAKDQQEFDEAVDQKGKTVLAALAGLGVLAAVVMSAIALIQSGQTHRVAMMSSQPAVTRAAAVLPAAATSTAVAKPIALQIIGSYKIAPDGKKHDAFTKTEFAVKVGQPLQLKIDNTDDVPHSITSPVVGVNITVQPGTHTYTLVVKEAGKFKWYCMIPCDSDANGWAMQNPGYMSGYITAT
jgi:heme/copper-type cytochrome/quinol oxidase subunit 2